MTFGVFGARYWAHTRRIHFETGMLHFARRLRIFCTRRSLSREWIVRFDGVKANNSFLPDESRSDNATVIIAVYVYQTSLDISRGRTLLLFVFEWTRRVSDSRRLIVVGREFRANGFSRDARSAVNLVSCRENGARPSPGTPSVGDNNYAQPPMSLDELTDSRKTQTRAAA